MEFIFGTVKYWLIFDTGEELQLLTTAVEKVKQEQGFNSEHIDKQTDFQAFTMPFQHSGCFPFSDLLVLFNR